MHSIYLPRSAKHTLELDSVKGNTKWRDAMAKEAIVKEIRAFEPISEQTVLKKEDGWHSAPFTDYLRLKMI